MYNLSCAYRRVRLVFPRNIQLPQSLFILIVLGSLIELWLVSLFLFSVAVISSEMLVAACSPSGGEK